MNETADLLVRIRAWRRRPNNLNPKVRAGLAVLAEWDATAWLDIHGHLVGRLPRSAMPTERAEFRALVDPHRAALERWLRAIPDAAGQRLAVEAGVASVAAVDHGWRAGRMFWGQPADPARSPPAVGCASPADAPCATRAQ